LIYNILRELETLENAKKVIFQQHSTVITIKQLIFKHFCNILHLKSVAIMQHLVE